MTLSDPARPGMAPFPPLTPSQRLRRTANWVNLATPAGLAVARVGGADVRQGPRGLLLADGYRFCFPVAGAFTVGDVVITRHRWRPLLNRRPELLDHEERHSWQYVACLGLPFLPLYLLAAGWSWVRTGDLAARNVFERQAGLSAGGYRHVPPRPLGATRTIDRGRASHQSALTVV